MANLDEALIWDLRAFIYQQFEKTSRPPAVQEAARQFGLSEDEAKSAYLDLHRRHALFLEPGTTSIRMANPFSAVPTPFRVHADGRSYWANCAWDALGIPAALHKYAMIDATLAGTGQTVSLQVSGREVVGHGELVHFALPFQRWYDDLIFT